MGEPCIAGTRISVEVIARRIAEGCPMAEVLAEHPVLTEQDVRHALEYAAAHGAKCGDAGRQLALCSPVTSLGFDLDNRFTIGIVYARGPVHPPGRGFRTAAR